MYHAHVCVTHLHQPVLPTYILHTTCSKFQQRLSNTPLHPDRNSFSTKNRFVDSKQLNTRRISPELAEAAESSMRQMTLYQRPRQESDLSELLDTADYIDDDVVDSASDPLDGEEVRTIAGRSIVTSGSNASSGDSDEGVVRLVSPITTTMQSPLATPARVILDESPAARINRHRKASRASSEASETVSIK